MKGKASQDNKISAIRRRKGKSYTQCLEKAYLLWQGSGAIGLCL